MYDLHIKIPFPMEVRSWQNLAFIDIKSKPSFIDVSKWFIDAIKWSIDTNKWFIDTNEWLIDINKWRIDQ